MLVALFLFALWGALRGALRQAASLVLLFAGLAAAGVFGGRLESAVGKVASLGPHGRCLTGWAAVGVGVILVGAALIAFARRGKRRLPGRRGAPLGALFGLVQGATVVVIAAYALLATYSPAPRPAFVDTLARSTAAPWIRRGGDLLLRILPVPPCVAEEARGVEARLP